MVRVMFGVAIRERVRARDNRDEERKMNEKEERRRKKEAER